MKHTLTIEGTADEIRTALDNLTGRVETPASTGTETSVKAAPAPASSQVAEKTDEPTVDAIGMPYDEAIHASPPSFKTDGSWKVKKGQADAAKAAIAAFKAAGGNVEAPVIEQPTGMPGTETKTAPTGMPGTAPVPTAEPVALDVVMAKWTGMLDNGTLSPERATEICVKVTGSNDATTHYQTFQTNETARAALYAELNAIEA
jgi:hypothetical protein